MATADNGKRRSAGAEEKDLGRGERKKRRRSRSRTSSAEKSSRHLGTLKKSKKKKKEKDRERKGDRFKVQSIAELAELVRSGQVQIPRSLLEYQSDKLQLLDQVFTILSPDDVKGMLPDILKNLKTKHVKQLCYDHLKTLSNEEIRQTILPPPPSASPASLPQDQDMLREGGKGGRFVKEREMENTGGKEGGTCDRNSGKDGDLVAGGADSTKHNESSPRKGGSTTTDSELVAEKGRVQGGGSDSEIVITISDVSEGSDDEMETRGTDVAPPENASLTKLPSARLSSSDNWHEPAVQPVGPSTASVTVAAASGGVRGEGRAGSISQETARGREKGTERHVSSKHVVEKENVEHQPSSGRTKPHHTSHAVSRVRPQAQGGEKSSLAATKEVERSKGVSKVREREQIHERDSRKTKETAELSCAAEAPRLKRDRPLDTSSDSKQAGISNQIAMAQASSCAKVDQPSNPEPTVGSAQLLEMELRRRALEAELRRNNASKHTESRVPIPRDRQGGGTPDARLSDDGEEMVCDDVILLHPEYEEESEEEGEGLRDGGRDQGGQDDGCKLSQLEERLRQRALQSMLDKKRKRNSTVT